MGGGRGLVCAKCNKNIDRHVEVIQCSKCENSLHAQCVKNNSEELKNLIESKEVKEWKCQLCMDITQEDQVNKVGVSVNIAANVIDFIYLTEEKRYVPMELIIKENSFLKQENLLLKQLMQEMSEKNTLLAEKLAATSKTLDNNKEKPKMKESKSKGTETHNPSLKKPEKEPLKNESQNPPSIGKTSYKEVLLKGYSELNGQNKTSPVNDESQTSSSHKDDEFKPVTYHKRPKLIIGTEISDVTNEFQAAESNIWVYVGRVRAEVTQDQVMNYIKEKTKEEKIICEEIKTSGPNKAFKVGINSKFMEQIYSPDFWPRGTAIRRYNLNLFRYKRTNNQQWESDTRSDR